MSVCQCLFACLLQDIFGLQHAQLLAEFKNILVSRGTLPGAPNPEDNWFSLPVSEIDFTSCQQCTPSYRALPPAYPKLECSERLEWEREVSRSHLPPPSMRVRLSSQRPLIFGAQILNDSWVSVPTGSEDFSFKNMRKNQYEEALFRCEDERYEIDMVIDNNASAIHCLTPLNAEITSLKAVEGFDWQFRLDRRSLGVLHLKAIARIYGEHGNEALELLRKNPAGAIPVILKV
jgi:paired amphipathic helix protein Sin3a